MKIELTDKELAILTGILGSTHGSALYDLYATLKTHLLANDEALNFIADSITAQMDESLRYHINEDYMFDTAVEQFEAITLLEEENYDDDDEF